MKKKLLVATWFFDDQPGFLDFAYRIESLARHYDLTIVLRSPRFMEEYPALAGLCEVIPTTGTHRLALLGYLRRLARRIRQDEFSLVVLLNACLAPLQLMLPNQACAVYWNEHPSHFYSTHSRNPLKRLFNGLMQEITHRGARRARRIMVIGEAFRDGLYAEGADPARVRLIYMGVDPAFAAIAPAVGSHDPVSLVYAGTISADRGRDIMLDGLALARQRGAPVRLTLIGATPADLAFCQARISALGIGDACAVHPRVPGTAIPGLLAAHDAGICLWENTPWWQFNPPTKLFEYLVAGLPVLASDIRTHTDYIRDGENGLIFPYSPEGFADALCRLTPDGLRRCHEGTRGDAARFLWPAIEPEFLRCIAEACDD